MHKCLHIRWANSLDALSSCGVPTKKPEQSAPAHVFAGHLWAIVQDICLTIFLVFGHGNCDGHPPGVGTVAFANHPFPRDGLGSCLSKFHGFLAALVPITLIPVIFKIKWAVHGDRRAHCISHVGWAAYGWVTHHLISNTGNTVFGLFLT